MACCSIRRVAESSTKMSFTIIRNLEQLPSYPMLCKLGEQNHAHVTGNERTGSFSCRGVEGAYEFGEDGIHGTFAGHGVTGALSFEIGKAAVTITDKPFWLPEMLLKQKITAGLDTFCTELASRRSS
jgi:hypothetical protein